MIPPATLTPAQVARIRLAPHFANLQVEFQARAGQLAAELGALNPSQLRGLANALSGGDQRSPTQQRRSLAEFLAWRALRAAKAEETSSTAQPTGRAWQEFAARVTGEIERIERDCSSSIDSLRYERETYWTTHASLLAVVQRDLTLRAIEIFIHTLIRLAIIHQQTAPSAIVLEGGDDAQPTHSTT